MRVQSICSDYALMKRVTVRNGNVYDDSEYSEHGNRDGDIYTEDDQENAIPKIGVVMLTMIMMLLVMMMMLILTIIVSVIIIIFFVIITLLKSHIPPNITSVQIMVICLCTFMPLLLSLFLAL